MAKNTAPAVKYPIERLGQNCRTLFGVSSSTFAGATAGMTGDFTVAEIKTHIDGWLKKPVVKKKEDKA